jgi:hypothetical protein
MTEHFCQYDRNRDEPCGKPARFHWSRLWLCAEHWDMTVEFFAFFGMTPKGENL